MQIAHALCCSGSTVDQFWKMHPVGRWWLGKHLTCFAVLCELFADLAVLGERLSNILQDLTCTNNFRSDHHTLKTDLHMASPIAAHKR